MMMTAKRTHLAETSCSHLTTSAIAPLQKLAAAEVERDAAIAELKARDAARQAIAVDSKTPRRRWDRNWRPQLSLMCLLLARKNLCASDAKPAAVL